MGSTVDINDIKQKHIFCPLFPNIHKRIPSYFSLKLTRCAPSENRLVCLKILLTGGADFIGGLGGSINSSNRLLTFALLWLNTPSLPNTGVGIGLLRPPFIVAMFLRQLLNNIF